MSESTIVGHIWIASGWLAALLDYNGWALLAIVFGGLLTVAGAVEKHEAREKGRV